MLAQCGNLCALITNIAKCVDSASMRVNASMGFSRDAMGPCEGKRGYVGIVWGYAGVYASRWGFMKIYGCVWGGLMEVSDGKSGYVGVRRARRVGKGGRKQVVEEERREGTEGFNTKFLHT